MIRSTIGHFPLAVNAVLRHGRRVNATSKCVTFKDVRRATYAAVSDNVALPCVVVDPDIAAVERQVLLAGRIATWQVPENWAFVDGIPKTSVGKFDKKALRAQYQNGDLARQRVRGR
jgi:acyl-CoA synthetase (AMP-forming)/AMP-acid ligase II